MVMDDKIFTLIIAASIIICVVAAYNLMAKEPLEPLEQHDLTALRNAEYKRQRKLNKRAKGK
jgi:hypothetical protein